MNCGLSHWLLLVMATQAWDPLQVHLTVDMLHSSIKPQHPQLQQAPVVALS